MSFAAIEMEVIQVLHDNGTLARRPVLDIAEKLELTSRIIVGALNSGNAEEVKHGVAAMTLTLIAVCAKEDIDLTTCLKDEFKLCMVKRDKAVVPA